MSSKNKSEDGFGFFGVFLLVCGVLIICLSAYMVYQKQVDKVSEVTPVSQSSTQDKNSLKTFKFNAVGDFDSNTNTDLVLEEIGKSKADFSLALGDLSYKKTGSETEWCNYVKKFIGSSHPFEIVSGNHDDGTNSQARIDEFAKCLPDKIGSLTGNYATEYYFDYNNLARIILISPNINQFGYDYTVGSSHYEWLKQAVDDARSKKIEWVFIGMHKNCITPGEKTCEIGEDIMNLALEKKVDVVLQGHEHAYFRSKQLKLSSECPKILINDTNSKCINSSGDNFIKGEGTILMIAGTGGKELRNYKLNDPENGYFDKIDALNSGNSYGFGQFEVSQSKISSKYINVSGGNFGDQFEIVKK